MRNLQAYLHPDSEHRLDWFHITMRITVLQQQVKTLRDEQPKVIGVQAALGKEFLHVAVGQ